MGVIKMTFEELKEESFQKIKYHHGISTFELRRLTLIQEVMESTQNEFSLDEVIEIVDTFYALEKKNVMDEIKKEVDKSLKNSFINLFGDKK